MLVQNRLLQKYLHKRIKKQADTEYLMLPIVSLEYAKALPHLGNKAKRLAELIALGLPVPSGFVITEYADIQAKDFNQYCSVLFRELELKHVVVRSSPIIDNNGIGNVEYNTRVCKNILNVSRSRLVDAVDKVRESLSESLPDSHAMISGHGSVVVQQMIDVQFSGVVITEHPCNGAQMLIEYCEDVDIKNPTSMKFGKYTYKSLSPCVDDIDFTQLLKYALKIEHYFGIAQDIEWVYRNGSFSIVQSKDIIQPLTKTDGYVERLNKQRVHALAALDVQEVGAKEIVLYQYDFSESLSCPTEVSWGILERIYAYDGSIHRALNKLSLKHNFTQKSRPWLIRVFGHVYVNKKEDITRRVRPFGFLENLFLHRRANTLKTHYLNTFLTDFMQRQDVAAAINLNSLDWPELTEYFSHQIQVFIESDYVEANVISYAEENYVATAHKKLSRINRKLSEYKLKDDTSIMPDIYAAIEDAKAGEINKKRLIKAYGHRARHDFELSEPRYYEKYSTLKNLASAHLAAMSNDSTQLESLDGRLRKAVVRALEFQELKEVTKHYTAMSLSEIRLTLLEIGKRLGLKNKVFHLTLNELLKPNSLTKGKALKQLLNRRKAQYEKMKKLETPQQYCCLDLENTSIRGSTVNTEKHYPEGMLSGEWVVGSKEYQGRVMVINTHKDLDNIQQGDILVAKSMSREWLGYMTLIGGIITETGGWLCHNAINAREHDVPCIVCVDGATLNLKDGQEVLMLMTGVVDRRLQLANKGRLTYNTLLQRDRRQASYA